MYAQHTTMLIWVILKTFGNSWKNLGPFEIIWDHFGTIWDHVGELWTVLDTGLSGYLTCSV